MIHIHNLAWASTTALGCALLLGWFVLAIVTAVRQQGLAHQAARIEREAIALGLEGSKPVIVAILALALVALVSS